MAPAASSRPAPRLRWLLATLSLLTLTGCFDLLQEIWVNPDGSARVLVDAALPKSLLDLAKAGNQDLMQELRDSAKRAEAKARQLPDVTQFQFRDYEKDGQYHLVYELTVRDASKLGDIYKQVMAETASKQQEDETARWDFYLERSGGDYVFVQRFGGGQEQGAVDAGEAGGEDTRGKRAKELGRQMAKALFANNKVTFRVHGPGIGETNGTVNEQKNTVEWKLSLAELMDESSPARELRAVVHAGEPLWLWPLVIGVPLAVLMLAIASARKRRRVAGP